MNSAQGVKPEQELVLLRRAGVTLMPGFEQHPDGSYRCDARTDEYRYIEVRSKDQFWSRFKHPFNDDPKTVGVMINVSSVAGRPSPILFIVECWAASFRPPEIYRTVIDPHTAPAQFYRAVGRDIQQTGRQECYFVPVENFTQIS